MNKLRNFAENHLGMYPEEKWGDFFWSAIIGFFAVIGLLSFLYTLLFVNR